MHFSAFTSFGFLAFAGGVSPAERVYNGMKAALTDPKSGKPAFDLSVGTVEEAHLYADAMTFAAARATLRRAANQNRPTLAVELLPNLEEDFGVIPGPNDTIVQRQDAVAAKKKRNRGTRREAVVDALRTALGSDFLAYAPVKSTSYVFPNPVLATSPVNAVRADVASKIVKLGDYVTALGAPLWVAYENLDPSADAVSLLKGDVVMVEPNVSLHAEKVTVAAVRVVGTTRELQATFTKPHTKGGVVTTQNWPNQISYARHVFVVLTAAAAIDPQKRRKADEVMHRHVKGSTSWSVVQATSSTATTVTIGPTTVSSPIGAVPIAAATYNRS